MDKTIREDVVQAVKVSLAVYDVDGAKVGFVDQVDKQRGWMVVRGGAVDQVQLWVPYRLVKSVDEREIFVTELKDVLEARFKEPPPRTTEVHDVDGRSMARTTEPSGFDQDPVVTSDVDLEQIKHSLAVEQRVWTADDVEIGMVKDFDSQGRYVVLEAGNLVFKRALVVPIALFADVDREAAEASLAVWYSDFQRMKHHDRGDSVIEMQSPVDH